MADESLRNRPHIYLRGHGKPIDYTAHQGGGGDGAELPERDRLAHADQLTQALTNAVKAGEALLAQRDSAVAGGVPGFYLEFEMPAAAVKSGIVKSLKSGGASARSNWPASVRSTSERLRRRFSSPKRSATTI